MRCQITLVGAGTVFDDLCSIDPEVGLWKQYLGSDIIGTPPAARAGLGFTSLAGLLYAFGGEGLNG